MESDCHSSRLSSFHTGCVRRCITTQVMQCCVYLETAALDRTSRLCMVKTWPSIHNLAVVCEGCNI